jgi:hypothetical protein
MRLPEYLSELYDRLSLMSSVRARYKQLMNFFWYAPPAQQEEQQSQPVEYPIEIYENRKPDFSIGQSEPYKQPENEVADQIVFHTPEARGAPLPFGEQQLDEEHDLDGDEMIIQDDIEDITDEELPEDDLEDELLPDPPEHDTLEDIVEEQMADENMDDQNLEDMLNKPFFPGG